jgi:hypothetical protein
MMGGRVTVVMYLRIALQIRADGINLVEVALVLQVRRIVDSIVVRNDKATGRIVVERGHELVLRRILIDAHGIIDLPARRCPRCVEPIRGTIRAALMPHDAHSSARHSAVEPNVGRPLLSVGRSELDRLPRGKDDPQTT